MRRFLALAGVLALAAVMSPLAAQAADHDGDGDGSVIVPECTGETPIVCHADVPPGNYDVTVVLGDAGEPGLTAVRAEARRMMLGEVSTAPGRFVRRSFSVNVREPEGEPTKTTSGTPGLTLTFTGASPRVQRVTVRPQRHARPVLYLAGDSTVCDQDTFPYTGWGQAIPQHLPSWLTVANYADSGESSGSFLADPRLFATMLPLVAPGDVVVLQFGHNDKTTTAEDYRANLTRLVTGVRERQARPVLVSPPVRRLFDSTGVLTPTARHVNGLGVDLPAEMSAVAADLDVPYIDLTADSAALVESLGPEDSKPLYLYDELRDNTHFSESGADRFGGLVLERLIPVLHDVDDRAVGRADEESPDTPLLGGEGMHDLVPE
ncbi:rhamnogalacturonan acetylesterase [Actinoplanes sp. NBRC 101535]|uniref:rhamnogalacturonan acetylesterase n=1 Tax=Actinoplanes sp. NBRC 101535 TaxID=3032196 RepID=UPI0024A2389F|nr:rhamnogalacturonan acetylesterase [Actinoplanes sp. NBRC 101535]GLY03127.1 rhamnogalacturonan acetylesterase [Actinoplanes sp. NBRC 101535]